VRPRWITGLVIGIGLVVLLSLVRAVTGSPQLTSSGTMGAALERAVPVGLAALGGLFAERSGVVNIGLEGMMILGTWGGAWVGFEHGPWLGVLAGVIAGALGGLVHAVATVTFGIDHIVSGVAINLIAPGLTRFLSTIVFTGPEGGATQSPTVASISRFSIPGVSSGSDVLGSLERHHWFLISDLAGVLGGLTGGVSYVTLIAVVLVPVSGYVLWRTRFGLRLRSCGENPEAAESLGVKVYRMKYAGVVISGALAGLAGAFLSLVAANNYQEGQTGGRGFIGLATLIFGNWRPGGIAAGASLFGYSDGLQLRAGGDAVHGLLLFVALLLLVMTLRLGWLRRRAQTIAAAAAAGIFFAWFGVTSTVPDSLTGMTPYLVTLLVLSVAAQRLRMPAADGLPYRRGQ
jgi:general nucleoside transport system permease protein